MNWNEFLIKCENTLTEECKNPNYLVLGLKGESGEVCDSFKKYLRGDYSYVDLRDRIVSEVGDLLWYLAISFKYGVVTSQFSGFDEARFQYIVNPVFDHSAFPTSERHVILGLLHIGRLIDALCQNIMSSNIHETLIYDIVSCISGLVNVEEAQDVVIAKLKERKESGTIKGSGETIALRKARSTGKVVQVPQES